MSILSNFTVVDLIKTRSVSIATITGKVLKFNIQTAAEMHYTPYVQVLVNPKDKQFAIRVCKEDAPDAIPFSKPEHEQKYAIKISAAAVVDLIRKMGEWPDEENWNVPGIYFADEQALVYDLGAAFKPLPRGGWTAKRQKEAAAAAALHGEHLTESNALGEETDG